MDMDGGTCTRVCELNAPCGFVSYGGARMGVAMQFPAKVVYAKSVSVNAMQIVYHGAYRRVCVNATKTSFGGGTENPYLCSAMRFRAHGTSCMYNYKFFCIMEEYRVTVDKTRMDSEKLAELLEMCEDHVQLKFCGAFLHIDTDSLTICRLLKNYLRK